MIACISGMADRISLNFLCSPLLWVNEYLHVNVGHGVTNAWTFIHCCIPPGSLYMCMYLFIYVTSISNFTVDRDHSYKK